MWATHHRSIGRRPDHAALSVLLLLFITVRCASAQAAPPANTPSSYLGQGNFNPSMAIVIVVLITAFFFLGFFSVYIRQCAGDQLVEDGGGQPQAATRSRRQRGMDPAVLETFPTLLYAEVKEHKVGKGALECAVCLSEFEDDETLRLLPKCSHVFHPDCIDAWLASHVTCPVCRSNLALDTKETPANSNPAGAPAEVNAQTAVPPLVEESRDDPVVTIEHTVVIDVENEEERQMAEDAMELERIGSVRRALRSKSSRRPRRFPRSHSTGHSLSAAAQPGEELDRYTLRLPEHVLREIVSAGKLKRTTSLLEFPAAGEGSSRPGYRGGEGSSRGGRSARLGRSDRWPSFFTRNFSAKFPAWTIGRRGDGEGSVKKGDGDGSTRGRFGSVKAQFDCLVGGGGAAKEDTAADPGELSFGRRV